MSGWQDYWQLADGVGRGVALAPRAFVAADLASGRLVTPFADGYLATEKVSVIYGHIHRREYAARTREDRDGPKEIMAATPGCLARIDGVVPSTKGGTDLDGRPMTRHEDWQQGCAVVRYEPGDGRFDYHNIAIHEGWALWQGKEYRS